MSSAKTFLLKKKGKQRNTSLYTAKKIPAPGKNPPPAFVYLLEALPKQTEDHAVKDRMIKPNETSAYPFTRKIERQNLYKRHKTAQRMGNHPRWSSSLVCPLISEVYQKPSIFTPFIIVRRGLSLIAGIVFARLLRKPVRVVVTRMIPIQKRIEDNFYKRLTRVTTIVGIVPALTFATLCVEKKRPAGSAADKKLIFEQRRTFERLPKAVLEGMRV